MNDDGRMNNFFMLPSMRILTDDSRKSMQPTKDNILDGLEWLVEGQQ